MSLTRKSEESDQRDRRLEVRVMSFEEGSIYEPKNAGSLWKGEEIDSLLHNA